MTNLKKLPGAIQFALFASAAALVSGNAFAQEATDTEQEAKTLDRVEVTGSRLKRAEIEGAVPVTVIDRASIDASGDISVADVLRDSTFASFGNFKPQSGSSAQSLATVDLRGVGSGRTLVLIDGHRAPTNPMSASSGSDLNAIPLAAVERIEILSDGASAVYGSDAIGGVVNIILRKDFNGVELRYGVGQTKIQGGDTEDFSVVFGVSGDRGRLIGGVSKSSRGMVFTRDQIGGDEIGATTYGNNYYDWYAGVGPDGDGAAPAAVPGFACNSNGFYLSQPLDPDTGLPSGPEQCSFNFNTVAANEASVDNKAIFVRGDYQINDDWTVYMTATQTRVETFGRYAPVPGVVAVEDGTINDVTPGDGLPTYFFHRFAAAGNRDNFTDTVNSDFMIGFQGQLTDKISTDFGVRRTNYSYKETGRGYIIQTLAAQAANNGDYIFADPFGASQETLNGFTATIGRDSFWKTQEVFGSVNFDLFEMGGGVSNAVIGAEYRKDEFQDIYDSLSRAGVVLGSSGGSSAGSRDVHSGYFEWLFPFTSTFDITVAGRYDKYSDYGNDFSPKIAGRWQPLDNLTFRGSYGEGFRAPGLDILTAERTFSAEPVKDPASCAALGRPSTCSVQVDTFFTSNPNLSSEQSKQWSLGVVYDPFDWLDLSLDYYNIKVEDTISQISAQDIINCSNDPGLYGACPTGFGLERAPNGRARTIEAGYANQGLLETEGLDFRLNTSFDLDSMGKLENRLSVSYINKFDIQDTTGEMIDQLGLGGAPDLRATLQNRWSYGDFSVDFNTNYIGGQDRSATPVGGYSTHDLQFSWKSPWNATIAIGATNVGDRYPELVPYDGRPWNFYLYDAYGRTTYFRYTQTF
ncbi:TonB-dependent receptor [Pseudoxanthomonas yeongjuensis]|uniref:TonB-dependent receptor plug domain-containing protein n=1 Tax=Pseudoxanthomonas yeongjuensis TaxID=377616 RepID=UPI001390F89E|nr:TonB-dependent receptor [Pseudoxanthomonas yeongjuensis]KAF1718566.1 TonB-dependent receptor [Pseudoxanthomonas yeongjuensis]